MSFALSEDQLMIRDVAEGFLAERSDSHAIRRAGESETGFDSALWERIGAELGWCALPVAEVDGGLGLGPVEMVLTLEAMGRHLLCSPYFATVCLGANLIDAVATSEARQRVLPDVAGGVRRLAVPVPTLEWGATGHAVSACRAGDQWMLNGQLARVVDGASADCLLVLALADGEDRPGLFAVRVETPGLAVTPLDTWDRTRRFADVELRNVLVSQHDRLDDPARSQAGFRLASARARLYLAAELLGGAQRCLDLTLAHVMERKQFGRTIASFQAVKHRCAEMMVRVEALRSAVFGAAKVLEGQPPLHELMNECSMARALASETAFFCAQEAIQLHGGVGFTWEYDPQLHFKRAQASTHWFGTTEALREALANTLLEDSPPAVAGEGAAHDRPASRGSPDEAFRAEVAAWMHQHLCGDFEALRFRGGPGDEEAFPELRKAWERELAAGGWTCVGWPQSTGGRGLSIEQQVIFHEEYARAGGPGRLGHIGEGLIGPTLIRFGSPGQKERFLPGILSGREFWAQGYSEPSAGSDLANVQTRCWQDDDGNWRVRGQKIWTSLAHQSDWIFVLARSEPGSRGRYGLSFLLLPLDQPGIEIRGIRQLSGSAEFNEVFFDGALAQAGHLIGQPGEGWAVAMGLLEAERGVSTLGQQMHFAHELDLVIQAARASGRSHDPIVRQRIAAAWGGLRVMRYNALRMLAGGDDLKLPREALIYKYYWSNWHRDLGKLAADVLGPLADVVSDDPAIRPLQQLFFFSRADTIYAGTNEIQLNLIAERGLGMPREVRPSA
ncbi:MAG: acyl-CoA dehydrogenase [Gammaproteobacteria bacterium]|nr:acyl-CoA dehydrogenase [Gammaproteobacteria bacterium]